MKIQEEKLQEIYKLLDEGQSGRRITQQTGVSYNTVLKYMREKRQGKEEIEPIPAPIEPSFLVKPSPEILKELEKQTLFHIANSGLLFFISIELLILIYTVSGA